MLKPVSLALSAGLLSVTLSIPAAHAGPREDIIAGFQAQAAAPANPANGAALFQKNFATGKPETPSCTTCHGTNPKSAGQTRTGKAIEPLAVSVNAERFTDQRKVDKWFRRNCSSVIGRECTAQEKVDFLSYMSSQ